MPPTPLSEPDKRLWRVAAGIPFRVRPAALAEPDLVRYTIRLPAGVIHRGFPRCETNQSCGHGLNPLSVGPCFSDSFSPTDTPSLRPHYRTSSLLWVSPTSARLRPLPRCLGLSEGAPPDGSPWLPRILLVRLDATSDPGLSVDTRPTASTVVACWVREPIGQIQRCRFRDSTSSGSASPVTFAPRLLSYLRIKRPVTRTPARLDTRPVASSYLGGTCTHENTRPCQAATPHPAPQCVLQGRPPAMGQRLWRILTDGHSTQSRAWRNRSQV